MTNRELLQEVLSEYSIFSDKGSDEFVRSMELSIQNERKLSYYLKIFFDV